MYYYAFLLTIILTSSLNISTLESSIVIHESNHGYNYQILADGTISFPESDRPIYNSAVAAETLCLRVCELCLAHYRLEYLNENIAHIGDFTVNFTEIIPGQFQCISCTPNN